MKVFTENTMYITFSVTMAIVSDLACLAHNS